METGGNPTSAAASEQPISAGVVSDWLRLLTCGGAVVEGRAIGVCGWKNRKHAESGFFDQEHLDALAGWALDVTGRAKGVYFTLHDVNPQLLARRFNRTAEAGEGELAKDKDVLRRRWLYIDIDPIRDAQVSSTEGEKALALDLAGIVRDHLRGLNWPDPILSDSGNGYSLFYRLDLPAGDGGLTQRCLQALASRFNTDGAKIDSAVFNAARVVKIPGTLARKGDSTPERPHRRSRLVEIPGCAGPSDVVRGRLELVPRELLEALAAEALAQAPTAPANGEGDGHTGNGQGWNVRTGGRRLDIEKWLTARGVKFRRKPATDGDGRTVWQLAECPFDASHAKVDAAIFQWPEGKLGAKCFHNSCAGRGWQDFKQAIGPPDPDHYDPPRRRSRASTPPPDASPSPEALPASYTIILDFFRERHQPVFRRGPALFSATLGRDVRLTEALTGPPVALVSLLAASPDAPRLSNGQVNLNALPRQFRTWAPSAWADLLAELPEEEAAGEGGEVDETAEEDFRAAVRHALLWQATLGETHYEDGREVCQTSRRSLICWCQRFARPGGWRDVRSFQLWCRLREEGSGLEVALRHDMFSQVGGPGARALLEMGPRRFARLAAVYGIGESSDATRVRKARAVKLTAPFVQELLRGAAEDLGDEGGAESRSPEP